MRLFKISAAMLATAAVALATPAMAQTDSYRVDANASQTINLNICNPEVRVSVRGDGDTDLDFTITNSSGAVVHSDFDLTDVTFATLNRRNDVQCENFQLDVTNLGGVWNQMEVSLETLRVDVSSVSVGQPGSFRVEANATQFVNLNICDPLVRTSVRGDGDTDVDFRVRDGSGIEVHSDFDLTDVMVVSLERRPNVQCEIFELELINIGSIWNQVGVTLDTLQADVVGSNDGRNRDVGIRNQLKETIFRIYWSNVGASDWGDDKLGAGTLAGGQQWNVTVDDASGACRFDFKAETASGRVIEQRNVDVCSVLFVDFQ